MSCETHAQSTVMRVMHVKLPSHSARGRYVVKAASQCVCTYLDRSLAMCLLKPSSLPQCVFAMRRRLPNVSSQFVFAYPMWLRNASAPPNASSQCVCACQCVCAFQCVFTQCVFRMRLCLQMSAPIKPFFDECVFAMRMRLQVVCHTPPQDAAMYICI